MTRKIENVWSTAASPPDDIHGESHVYTVVSGLADELIGSITIRKTDATFWTGPYGESEVQPDDFLGTDKAHTYEMANEYYTGALASGSETVIEDNITYRVVEDA